jgi:hypothetical protein
VTGTSQFRVLVGTEIMIVTNVSGTTFTVTRGAEGTTAASHSSGDADHARLHRRQPAAAWQSMDVGRPVIDRNTGTFDQNYALPGWIGMSASGMMTGSAPSLAAGTIYYTVIYLARSAVFDRIAVKVTTAAASGGYVRLGMYAANANLEPGTLQFDAGTVLVDAVGVKEITISQTVPQGWYFIAVLPSASVTCNSPGTGMAPPVTVVDYGGGTGQLIVPKSTGQSAASALPGTAPSIAYPNTGSGALAGFLRYDRTAN